MKYMCLIYDDEKAFASLSDADRQSIYGMYRSFSEDIAKAGKYVSGSELAPTHTATTVRVRNGKPQTTDGPFLETREALGGFYIIDAKDLDEAVSIAARIPSARSGAIEVRPLIDNSAG
jgi:hypothetical protein